MQKVHKLLEEHRPQKIKIAPLMFSNIKNRITHNDSFQQSQTPQSVIRPADRFNDLRDSILPSLKVLEETLKKSQSKQQPRRLKLKDYMRLNEISREKKSRSAQSKKLSSISKPSSITPIFDPRSTFGPQGDIPSFTLEAPSSKRSIRTKTYSQQILLQRQQLTNTLMKTKQKFSKITQLIEETNDEFTNYNDLVFMFRIEEVLNDYIIKGIETIKTAYNQHFVEGKHDDVLKTDIRKRLETISGGKKNEGMHRSPALRAERRTIEISLTKKHSSQLQLPVSFQPPVIHFESNNFPPKLEYSLQKYGD